MSYRSLMKNRLFIFGIVFIAAFFTSCASKPVVYDETVPEEETAHIYFYSGLEILSFKGTPVRVHRSLSGVIPRSSWRNMILPAGDMVFRAAGMFNGMNNLYITRRFTFRYNFEPGTYTLVFFPGGIDIYTGKQPAVGYPSKKNFVEKIKVEISEIVNR